MNMESEEERSLNDVGNNQGLAVVRCIVRGRATTQDGQPAADLLVEAFDRNVGLDDAQLGQATTDPEGNYSITYRLKQLSGKSAADLVMCVYRDASLVHISDILFNAPREVVKDFNLPCTTPSEFQHLIDTIKPLLSRIIRRVCGGRLAQSEVNFLSNKTRTDEE